MSDQLAAWVVVAGAGAGTFAIRATLALLAQRLAEVPVRVRDALRMIPPAALAALTVPALMRPEQAGIDVVDARFVAGVVAFLVAWKTQSLLVTITVGMVAVTLLQQVPGLG